MMMRKTLVTFSKMFGPSILALMRLLPNSSLAAERKIETTVLAKSTQDWGGSVLEHYAEGQPEVTVARVTIPAGMALRRLSTASIRAVSSLGRNGLAR